MVTARRTAQTAPNMWETMFQGRKMGKAKYYILIGLHMRASLWVGCLKVWEFFEGKIISMMGLGKMGRCMELALANGTTKTSKLLVSTLASTVRGSNKDMASIRTRRASLIRECG